jgi:hypothetical protein
MINTLYRNRGTFCNFSQFRHAAGWLVALCLLPVAFGCSPVAHRQLPPMSGSFHGVMADGAPLRLTVEQDGDRVTGFGRHGDRSFAFSGLPSRQVNGSCIFDDRSVMPAAVVMSPDGQVLAVRMQGGETIMERGGEPVVNVPGPFNGRYASGGRSAASVRLLQDGVLLAGTGFVSGRPVAVSGRVVGEGEARGDIQFADESRQSVRVSLSGDRQQLTVTGIGAPIVMKRRP